MNARLQGQSGIVTGAARRIGTATARLFDAACRNTTADGLRHRPSPDPAREHRNTFSPDYMDATR
jgi:NAD(P)-dependent dehydrogenase (short-subunit alcohol dehydrogenase family)